MTSNQFLRVRVPVDALMKQKDLKIGQRFIFDDPDKVFQVVDKRFFNIRDYIGDPHSQIKITLTHKCVSLRCSDYPNVPFYGGEDPVGTLLE